MKNKKDITIRYSKKENDLEVNWEIGHKATASYIIGLFNKGVQEELEKRGYDIKTIKFSINKKVSKNVMIGGYASVDENLMYINKHYNMDLKKGMIVFGLDEAGKILGGDNYVWLKHKKNKISCYHPQDISFTIRSKNDEK